MAAVVLREKHSDDTVVVPAAEEATASARRDQRDGARGGSIALGLVHATRGWIVRRRLQRREYGADWLMVDAAGEARRDRD